MYLLITLLATASVATTFLTVRQGLKVRDERLRRLEAEYGQEKLRLWLDTVQTRTPVMAHSIDRHGHLLSVSERWLEALGYTREEVIGRPITDFFTEESRDKAEKTHIPEFYDSGIATRIPYQIVTKNGEIRDVLLSAIGEVDDRGEFERSFAIMMDISEQKRAEQELGRAYTDMERRVQERTAALNEAYEHLALEMNERKRSETILRTIAEGVSGTTGTTFFSSLAGYLAKTLDMDYAMFGVFEDQPPGTVRTIAFYAEGNIEENFTYELSGTPCSHVLKQGMCLFPQNVQQFFPDDKDLAELDLESYMGILLKNSAAEPIGLMVVMGHAPVTASGTVTSMLQILASRAASELERMQQEDRLMQVRNLESLGRMAAGIAHEVNNPLTNASLNIQMLRRKLGFLEGQTPIVQRIDSIERNIERASTIARELLLFSRQPEMELEPVDINNIIDKAFAQITHDLSKIDVTLDKNETPAIPGDPLKLEGLFINLFNNAIEAMPDGGTLSITTLTESGKIIIKIKDTGIGIPEKHLTRVFDPFFTTKEVGAGTGLGLSIAYGIVRQHHGTIEARGSSGHGATIIVKLPVSDKESS